MALDAASQAYLNAGGSLSNGAIPAGFGLVNGKPAQIPTTAPTGTTSVTAPQATPTAVVSAGPAIANTNKIQNTLTQATSDLANHQAVQQQTTLAQDQAKAANQGKPGYDVLGNPIASATPEQQIADTPDPGNAWYYDAQGNKVQSPIGAPPAGYSAVNPKVGPTTNVANSASLSSGTTFKQFADGTYGQYDAQGGYVGAATANQYNTAKDSEDITASFKQALNGSYPLKPYQQAQISNVQAMYQKLIDQQTVANANFTGGTTVAQNLYGMGNSLTGLGAIKGSIDAGISKIADIQGEMAGAVAKMQAAFDSDNLELLKSAYTLYSKNADDLQKNIDKMHDDAVAAQDKVQAEKDKQEALVATQNNSVDNDIRAILDEAGKGGATSTQIKAMNDALKNHDYAGAVQAAAGSLQDPTSPAGQYSEYVKKQTASGKSPMTAGDFIAAQKYKDAYASASASAAAQSEFTSSDKNQSKLEHQLQQAALSSRSDLGIQNKKVSSAIDLQKMIDSYKGKDGNYNIPATNYGELVLGLATLLSPTGVPSEGTRDSLTQKTAAGDIAGAVGYLTGSTPTGTTQDVIKNLVMSIQRQGETAEQLRNKEMDAQTPTDLDQSRVDHVLSSLPSFTNMSHGDVSYQTPEQINDTAVTKLADVQKTNPQMLVDIHAQFPNMSPVEIAQKLGLMPTK